MIVFYTRLYRSEHDKNYNITLWRGSEVGDITPYLSWKLAGTLYADGNTYRKEEVMFVQNDIYIEGRRQFIYRYSARYSLETEN